MDHESASLKHGRETLWPKPYVRRPFGSSPDVEENPCRTSVHFTIGGASVRIAERADIGH